MSVSVRAAWRGGGVGRARAHARVALCAPVSVRVFPTHPPRCHLPALPPAATGPVRRGPGRAAPRRAQRQRGGGPGRAASPASSGERETRGLGGGGAAGKSEPPREEFSSAPVCLHSPSAQGFVICVFPFPVGRWSRLISLPHPLFRYVFCNCFPVALSPSRRIAHPRKGTRKRRLRSSRHTKGRSHLRPLQEQE